MVLSLPTIVEIEGDKVETALPMTLRRLLEAGLSIFDGLNKSYTGDYSALTGNKLNICVTFFFQERRELL